MGRAFVIAALLAWSVGARAAPDDAARAQQMFDDARALAKAGKTAEACALFERSLALDAAVGTQLNVADCAERDGHLARAWQLFDAAAAASEREGNAARAKFAHNRADALAARLATIVVHVAQPSIAGLTVTIGGAAVAPRAELRQVVEPGEVAIDASAPDHVAFHSSITATAGATVTVDVPALALVPVTPAEPPPVKPPPVAAATVRYVDGPRARGRVRLAWILGGGAVVGGGVAIAIGAVAKSRWDRAVAAHDYAEANHQYAIGNVGTGVGIAAAVLAIGATVVYVTAPRERVAVKVTASASALGIAVAGGF